MAQTKTEWRCSLLAARAAISETRRRSASEAIATRVRSLRCFVEARTLLGYVAIGAEVDPAALLVREGFPARTVLVPGPDWRADDPQWVDYGAGSSGRIVSLHAVPRPILTIVPGVGFDVFGMRLGRGVGFYDRALAKLRNDGHVDVVGLAFECQIVPKLPGDPWDERVDFIASEERLVTVPLGSQHAPEAGAR